MTISVTECFLCVNCSVLFQSAKIEVPEGSGTALGEIPRIDASISRFKNDDLRLLHRLLFKTPGKTTVIKKNIKKFNGFDFKKDTEEYNKKVAAAQKFEVKQLKSICEMLDLEKKGNKDEIIERVVDFLLEPKDSGKPAGGGRPKRTAAVRANNRGMLLQLHIRASYVFFSEENAQDFSNNCLIHLHLLM